MAGFANGALTLDYFPFSTSAGENNDVEISGSLIFVTPTNDGDSITGFIPQVTAGILLFVANIDSTNNLIIKNNDSSSLAANRIITSTGNDIVVGPEQNTLLGYDTQQGHWHAVKFAPEPISFTYFGPQNVDGTVRIGVVGTDFVFQQRVAGVYSTFNSFAI